MSLAVELIFNYEAIEPVVVWQKLMESHPDIVSLNDKGTFYNSNVSASEIEKAIRKQGKPHFRIEFDNAVFQYGAVGNFDHSFLVIEKCIKNIDDTHSWVTPFLSIGSFVQGRAYDNEYEFWQNASDPLEYESASRSYDHLPMKSNNLPLPLEQFVIDTSQNPGRRIMRDGYVEAIGAVMWFGKQFWQLTRTKQKAVLDASWLKWERIQSEVLLIKAKDSLFVSSGDGELQNKLRSLLYPKTNMVTGK